MSANHSHSLLPPEIDVTVVDRDASSHLHVWCLYFSSLPDIGRADHLNNSAGVKPGPSKPHAPYLCFVGWEHNHKPAKFWLVFITVSIADPNSPHSQLLPLLSSSSESRTSLPYPSEHRYLINPLKDSLTYYISYLVPVDVGLRGAVAPSYLLVPHGKHR